MDGARLRDVRKDHGDTQEMLAKKLGLSTPTVSKWEQGLTDPTIKSLTMICQMYNVTSDYLLGLSDDDPLLVKKRRSVLSENSKEVLRVFEEFLINQEKKRMNK